MNIANLARYVLAVAGTSDLAKLPALAIRRRRLQSFMLRGEKRRFPYHANPRVSFVIPVFNGAYHTLECLLSILRLADSTYEVIIVDDGCSDETIALLGRFDNVRLHRNEKNIGFLRSINAGSKLAKGEYLILFNNDARLVEGSLNEAINAYECEKNCGFMGVRVRHVSGGLQEAGCIIYQDGTTNGYLRYQREDDLRALFQRDVDYCSGVFAIVARLQFQDLSGLDEAFAPAYFEETDFCMRLRQKGLRCIYYPRLLIDHFEFGSSANAKASRRMINERREKFLSRWKPTLQLQRFFPREGMADIDSAALRLLQHPCRLLIVDENSIKSLNPQVFAGNSGHTTIYVLGGKSKLLKLLFAKFDVRVAWALGNRDQLKRFVSRRQGVYDVIEAKTEFGTEFLSELRNIVLS